MYLYLIRHGESVANAENAHAGWAPYDLTELGRQQAAKTRELLKDVSFDGLYVSDVKRAQQTANIIFGDMPRTFITDAREMNNTTMRGLHWDEMYEKFGEEYAVCRAKFDYGPLGIDCEGSAHFLRRAKDFLNSVATNDNIRVAVVCHAGFIRACAANVLGLTDHNPPITCRNASVSILNYYNDRWRLTVWDQTDTLP